MTQMADNALNKDHHQTTSMPNHMAELGSGNFDREFTLTLLGNEENALAEIEASLERIENGTYGQCDECAKAVEKPRLTALPFARLCVKCQSAIEHGKVRFRPFGETLAQGAEANAENAEPDEAAE